MADKINFEITTPESIVFSEQVDEVVLPTPQGEIGILPNHIPLVSLLLAGELRIKKGDEVTFLAVSGGFIEVRPDKVIVLADTAERAEDIDEQRAEEARKKAQEMITEKRVDATEFAALSAKIEKELARLRVKRRRHRSGGAGGGTARLENPNYK